MTAKGVHITEISRPQRYGDARTTVRWTYDGSLNIRPEAFWVSPALKRPEDEQSFALATLAPLAAAAGEVVTFPTPVDERVVEFWRVKLAGLSPFFKRPLAPRISPVASGMADPPKRGDAAAILWGGGYDCLATLGRLMARGIRPRMVRVHYAGYHLDLPSHVRYRLFGSLAEQESLIFAAPGTTSCPVQWNYRGEIGRFIEPAAMPAAGWPAASKNGRKVADTLLYGFQLFFAAMAVLPDRVGRIYLASSLEDQGEPFGLGFNANNDADFFGLKMICEPWKTKVEQYHYLHHERPELVRWVKMCAGAHGKSQWCGHCHRCTLSHLLQLAARVDEPITLRPDAGIIKTPFRLGYLKSAWEFYKAAGPVDEAVREAFGRHTVIKEWS